MNKTKQTWQNIDYVYGLFFEKRRLARTRYQVLTEKWILEDKRPDLTGGGLLLLKHEAFYTFGRIEILA